MLDEQAAVLPAFTDTAYTYNRYAPRARGRVVFPFAYIVKFVRMQYGAPPRPAPCTVLEWLAPDAEFLSVEDINHDNHRTWHPTTPTRRTAARGTGDFLRTARSLGAG
jgi:hypothetical protein